MIVDKIKIGEYTVKTPAVCGAVRSNTVAGMIKTVKKAFSEGADLVELRIDAIKGASGLDELFKIKKPIILTNRPKREGGEFKGSENERVNLLLEGIKSKVPCVDLELSTPAKLRNEVISNAKRSGVGIVLSYHNFSKTPAVAELEKIARDMEKIDCDMIKIVTNFNEMTDAFNVLEFLAKNQPKISVPVIAFVMGNGGLITRFIAPMLGSPLVYAAADVKTAPGQLDVATTKKMLKELTPKKVQD